MKIKYTPILFIILAVILGFLGNSFFKNDSGNYRVANPKPVKSVREIISEKKQNSKFDNVKLFEYKNSDVKNTVLGDYIKSCTMLKLNRNSLDGLLNSKNENITFEIPLAGKTSLYLELTKNSIFAENFQVRLITEKGYEKYDYKPGVYYCGIVKDKPNSTVSINVFENSVSGVISDETGNYNLGVMKEDKSGENYIYYNDRDLKTKNKLKCGVDDFGKMNIKNNIHRESAIDEPAVRQSVKIYFVADYQTYVDRNSNPANVSTFVTEIFNEVRTIYLNEFLPIELSSIDVYTVPDPYRNLHNSILILARFGGNLQDTFTGDLAHLLSTRNERMGGISWIRTLCSQFNPYDSSGRYSFSDIDNDYLPFPNYSWTVTVVAHEMGHSFGSMHTHACVWPITSSTIGQIDSCYYSEGGCVSVEEPNQNGTIMSYCHLNGATNLALGFGSMPGDTIRLRYNQGCFGPVVNSSELPTKFNLAQNFPNPFNPSTTISFAVPQDAFVTIKVYDISGREIAEVMNNKFYSRGFQNIIFNSAQFNLSSGIYFYKLIASNSTSGNIFTQVKKMILLK